MVYKFHYNHCWTCFFRNILEKSKDEEGKGKVYTMFNFKAPPFMIYWLYNTLVQVTGLAFIEFWDDFLLEESFDGSTDKHIACFSCDWPNQKLNCLNLLDDNVTSNSIICYKFVFELGSALGSSLGVITTFGLGIYIAILLLLKFSNGSRGTKWHKRCACFFQVFAVLMLFILTNALIFLWTLTSHLTIKESVENCLKTGGIGGLMAFTIAFVPWWKFKDVHTYEMMP